MLLVKIKPLGWTLILLGLVGVALVGFVLSRIVAPQGSGAVTAASGSLLAQEVGAFSKTATFAHVPASDPRIATALPADDLDTGEKKVGQTITITGQVVKIFAPTSGGVRVLNFAEDYRSAFSAAVEATDFGKFPDPNTLSGKHVLVTGPVIVFREHLQIKLTAPEQIQIIDGRALAGTTKADPGSVR